MRRLALGLGLVTMLSACGGAAASASPVATDKVDLPRSYLFSPAAITVAAGTTVTWTNDDNFTHSVNITTGGHFVGAMKPGQSVSYTFATPGTFSYVCTYHPQNMTGTVIVTSP